MFDEVEQRRLGPVDVIEHEHDGTALGQGRDQSPDGPEDLGERERGVGQTSGRGDPVGYRLVPDEAQDPGHRPFWRVLLVDPGRLLDDLDQGPERDAAAVGEAPAADDVRLVGEESQELTGQS